MRILVIEDSPERIKWFRRELVGNFLDVAETAKDGIKYLSEKVYDLLFLDHDLMAEHYENPQAFDGTGSEVAKFLSGNPTINPNMEIIIHSLNDCGSQRMMDLLSDRRCYRITYVYLLKIGLEKILSDNLL